LESAATKNERPVKVLILAVFDRLMLIKIAYRILNLEHRNEKYFRRKIFIKYQKNNNLLTDA